MSTFDADDDMMSMLSVSHGRPSIGRISIGKINKSLKDEEDNSKNSQENGESQYLNNLPFMRNIKHDADSNEETKGSLIENHSNGI